MPIISRITLPSNNTYDIRAGHIPYASVDGTSTSSSFTATVSGISSLEDGTCVMLKNSVVSSLGEFSININSLGAKPVYTSIGNSTSSDTIFPINSTMLFVYDSTLVTNGCWVCYQGYDTNTNITIREWSES